MQPKYIPQFVAKQLDGDFDVVTGTRYAQEGGVAGWDTRRKLTSRGANFCAATLLNPGVSSGLTPPVLTDRPQTRHTCSHLVRGPAPDHAMP